MDHIETYRSIDVQQTLEPSVWSRKTCSGQEDMESLRAKTLDEAAVLRKIPDRDLQENDGFLNPPNTQCSCRKRTLIC